MKNQEIQKSRQEIVSILQKFHAHGMKADFFTCPQIPVVNQGLELAKVLIDNNLKKEASSVLKQTAKAYLFYSSGLIFVPVKK